MRTFLMPLLIIGTLLAFTINGWAQKINATVSTQEAYPGEVIKWTISIEGTKGSIEKLPSITPFRLVSGPSTFLNMQYSFGKKIIQQEWTYHVKVPETTGKFTLPAVPVIAGKKKFTTNPILITVSSNQRDNQGYEKNKPTGENPSSIILSISKEKANVGEQLILEGYIVSSQDIITLELNKAPFSPDVFLQELNIPNEPVEPTQINGKTYFKQLIYRAAVFPQRAGKITIGPLQLRALARGDISENAPFAWLDNNIVEYELKSDNLTLMVSDPFVIDSNLEGCGNFEIQTQSLPKEVFQGQKFTWWVKLSGYGDANRINRPEPILHEIIKYYPEPDRPAESIVDKNGIRSVLSYQYTLVADDTGTVKIKLPFCYFNTTLDKIDTLILEETVQIKASTAYIPQALSAENETGDLAITEFKSMKGMITLISLMVFTFLIIWLIRKNKKQETKEKTSVLKQKKALVNNYTSQNHTLLHKYALENNHEAFFKVMRREMTDIINDMINNSNGTSDNVDVISLLSQNHWSTQEIETWNKLAEVTDRFLYGMKSAHTESLQELLFQFDTLRRKIMQA
jgi:hypothetical protein